MASVKQIILSPELVELAQNNLLIPDILFNSEENDARYEENVQKFLEGLPKGIVGIQIKGRFFLRKDLGNLIPDLEKDFVFPEEQTSK